MPLTITSANSVVLFSIPGLFPVPVQIQGFQADAAFATDSVEPAEVVMGVDGKMSAGYTPYMTKQTYSIQADSSSAVLFDAWQAAQKSSGDIYFANATIVIPGVGRSYTMTKGALTGYKAIPDAKKVLQGREFTVTWEGVDPTSI